MIERVVFELPGLGEVVCLREGKNRKDAREASVSRLGIWEWNRNYGVREWSKVPEAALRGERKKYHVRSALRRRAIAAYRRMMHSQGVP